MGENGMFMPYQEVKYPGYTGGNGYVENLASYRENVRWFQENKVQRSDTFQFDIERHVSWDYAYKLFPFQYSMMVGADYAIPSKMRSLIHLPSGPTRDEFESIVKTLPGFQIQKKVEQGPSHCWYENSSLGILINWNIHSGRYAPKHIAIAVVYGEQVSTLDTLVQKVLPDVVRLFNTVNPMRQLDPNIVQKTIVLARQRDTILPKSRLSV